MDVKTNNLYSHHDAHPLVLDLHTTKLFGPEWFLWEPETLRILIPQETGQTCSELNWNKLQACKTVHVNPGMVFDEWEVFLRVITALNNVIPDADIIQQPNAPRLYAGVGMLKMLDPKEDFSREVTRFIAASLLFKGIIFAPGELSFTQELLREPYYVCPDCGNEEKILDDHDGVCDACGRNWYVRATGKPIKDPRVSVHYRHDIAPIQERFNKVANDWDNYVPDEDDPIDVQICRIADAIQYKAIRDARFLEQKERLGL